MARNTTVGVVNSLQNGPFSFATDGSNESNAQFYLIVVTYFDTKLCKIVRSVLSVPALAGDSTGRNIGNLIVLELASRNIPISHCIAFGADNAPVMLGKTNGVVSVLKEKQDKLIVMGCLCHLLNLVADKAASRLPVAVDEILVDIYYYFERNIKRKERLQVFQELHNKDAKKVLCLHMMAVSRKKFEEISGSVGPST